MAVIGFAGGAIAVEGVMNYRALSEERASQADELFEGVAPERRRELEEVARTHFDESNLSLLRQALDPMRVDYVRILLEGADVVVYGTLAANGGGGGAGYQSNPGYHGNVAESGLAGYLSADPAPGGTGSGIGGSGGSGSAGTTFDGAGGNNNQNGGGGGGGAGRIRINTTSGNADIRAGAVFSPTANLGQCTGICSQGTVAIW